MFSFDVSFDKTRRFISVILFICMLKFKLVDKSTPRYLAEDTLSRNFDGLCSPVNTIPASVYSKPIE